MFQKTCPEAASIINHRLLAATKYDSTVIGPHDMAASLFRSLSNLKITGKAIDPRLSINIRQHLAL